MKKKIMSRIYKKLLLDENFRENYLKSAKPKLIKKTIEIPFAEKLIFEMKRKKNKY